MFIILYEELWEKTAEFHGHKCGGLAIGFNASLLAMKLLRLQAPAQDEEIVCVSENDACGVDAVQAVLGCTMGKGNLLLRLRGKQAFSFFNRKTGEGVRLVLKEMPPMSREEKLAYMLQADPEELFWVKQPSFKCPGHARFFCSEKCAVCGEITAEKWLRVKDRKLLCIDCSGEYEQMRAQCEEGQ